MGGRRADVKESAAERRWQKSLKIYATEMPRKPHETKATFHSNGGP